MREYAYKFEKLVRVPDWQRNINALPAQYPNDLAGTIDGATMHVMPGV